jgi:CRISPR-associated endonuclease/helicase Cas3
MPNTTKEYLARSADPERGIPTQTYLDHVGSVFARATRFANEMVRGTPMENSPLASAVAAAAQYHDLGKLHPYNQVEFRKVTKNRLPVRHEAAGVQYLKSIDPFAALLVQSHHANVPNITASDGRIFFGGIPLEVALPEDNWLSGVHLMLTPIHKQIMGEFEIKKPIWERNPTPLDFRMALSCLVDADHGDAARHKNAEREYYSPPTRWKERLDALVYYVNNLPRDLSDDNKRERQRLRDLNFAACLNASTEKGIRSCSSTVGTGKTTSAPANALQVSHAHAMRRIITVLPYTAIIDQTTEVYKAALILPGEAHRSGTVVSPVHHAVDFDQYWLRKYSVLFNAPIVVTTAVNFFETLASKTLSGLRKLHQYANSVIIIDEAHLALQLPQWRIAWVWLRLLVRDYGCHVILSSGTQLKFWEHADEILASNRMFYGFVSEKVEVKPLLSEDEQKQLQSIEPKRISIIPSTRVFNGFSELWNSVSKYTGPRLVVFNTTRRAANFARFLKDQNITTRIFHISTVLTPLDRARKLRIIRRLLNPKTDMTEREEKKDMIVCATSCMEVGLDLSFARSWRERSSLMNYEQIGGRTSRNFEYENAQVEEFRLDPNVLDDIPVTSNNPGINVYINATERFLAKGLKLTTDNIDAYLRLLREEMSGMTVKSRTPKQDVVNYYRTERNEKMCQMKAVTDAFDVIETNQRVVLVKNAIVEKIQRNEFVRPLTVMMNSVRIGEDRIDKMGLPVLPVFPNADGKHFQNNLLYMDESNYDTFYGYLLSEIEPANIIRALVSN